VPPLQLIQEMIERCPRMITQSSHHSGSGHTPLHLLFRGRIRINAQNVEDIARLLIQTDQKCLMLPDLLGWLPIHSLFLSDDELIRPAFLEFVIQPFPQSIAFQNKGGVTPFQMFWDSFAMDDDARCVLNVHVATANYYNEPSEYYTPISQQNSGRMWECILLMIRYAHEAVISDGDRRPIDATFQPLHKLASSALPTRAMMDVAIKIHGREIHHEDNEGNLPLHCACKRNHDSDFEKRGTIKALVEVYPRAAHIRNNNGHLPLFLALQNGVMSWEHGIKQLVQAYPDALTEKDPISHMYPFIIIASQMGGEHRNDRCESLDCLFHFIRACPDLIGSNYE